MQRTVVVARMTNRNSFIFYAVDAFCCTITLIELRKLQTQRLSMQNVLSKPFTGVEIQGVIDLFILHLSRLYNANRPAQSYHLYKLT
jgi:hypothetical protein